MTKYVISGYIGFDNFGDEAIAKVLTDYLKELNAEKITYISSNPKKTAELYGIDSVGTLKFIPEIKNCDVLISGGGSLLQDVTSLKSLIYYLAVIVTALVFNKKVVIFKNLNCCSAKTVYIKWFQKENICNIYNEPKVSIQNIKI